MYAFLYRSLASQAAAALASNAYTLFPPPPIAYARGMSYTPTHGGMLMTCGMDRAVRFFTHDAA
jgi:hypothetical protein